jgi:hypothetical protein
LDGAPAYSAILSFLDRENVMNIDGFSGRPVSVARADATALDLGLRRYMLTVYNYMAAGLGLTGLVYPDSVRIRVVACSTARDGFW